MWLCYVWPKDSIRTQTGSGEYSVGKGRGGTGHVMPSLTMTFADIRGYSNHSVCSGICWLSVGTYFLGLTC